MTVGDRPGGTYAVETPFVAGNPVVFTITSDPRPGLFEGQCALCGWQPMTAQPIGVTARILAEHVAYVHGVPHAR